MRSLPFLLAFAFVLTACPPPAGDDDDDDDDDGGEGEGEEGEGEGEGEEGEGEEGEGEEDLDGNTLDNPVDVELPFDSPPLDRVGEDYDCFRFTVATSGTLFVRVEAPDCFDVGFAQIFDDGETSTFRSFASFLGGAEDFCTEAREILAPGTYVACSANPFGLFDDAQGLTLHLEFDPAPLAGACDGGARVNSAASLALVGECTSLTGDLFVTGDLADIDALGGLTQTKDVRIDSEALVDMSGLFDLQTAALVDVRSNTLLGEVSFPALTTAEAIEVELNDAVTSVDLPVLSTLDEVLDSSFSINGNDLLTSFSAPAVTTVPGDVRFEDNPLLAQCAIDAFIAGITVGGVVEASGNDDVASCR